MRLEVEFTQSNQTLDIDFGEVHNISDGGYEKGFAEGKTKGHAEGYEKGYNTGLTEGTETGYQKGYNEASSENYLRICNRPNFAGLGLFDKEDVVLNFDYAYLASQMIYTNWGDVGYNNTTVKHLTVNFAQQLLNTAQMFCYTADYDNILERITINADFSKSVSALQLFSHCTALRVVDGTPLDLSSVTRINHFAAYCTALEEVRFAPNTIKVDITFAHNGKLSNATIQSIVDGLADLTGGTAQKVTFHTDVLLKLTPEQTDTIFAKNWTF